MGKMTTVDKHQQYIILIPEEDLAFGTRFRAWRASTRSLDVQIWCTSGHEQFHSLSVNYFSNTLDGLNVFDLTLRQTFNDIDNWITDVKRVAPGAHLVLIGNKSDLVDERVVTEEEA